MVPMRDNFGVRAFHEPCFRRRPSEGAKRLECVRLAAAFPRQKAAASSPHSKRCRALSAPRRFMVPRRGRKTVEAFHEPCSAGFRACGFGRHPAASSHCGQGCPQNPQPGWLRYEVHGHDSRPDFGGVPYHEPSRIEQRLVACNLSLVTGDLQRSGPSVSQSPVTSYQLQVSWVCMSLLSSWSQLTSKVWRCRLSMNLRGVRLASPPSVTARETAPGRSDWCRGKSPNHCFVFARALP